MVAFSKPEIVNFTCYELGHTWEPSCVKASLGVAGNVMTEALKIYGSLYFIAGLLRKRGKAYFLKKWWQETLQSSIFLTTNGTLFITCFCLWRKLMGFYFYLNAIVCGLPACALSLCLERKERLLLGRYYYSSMAFIPAVTASYVAILLERKSRRGLLAVYMANVGIETLFRMMVARGWITPMPNGEVLLFSIASAIYFYYFRKKDGLPSGTVSLLRFVVGADESPRSSEEVSDINSNLRKSIYPKWLTQNICVRTVFDWLNQFPRHSLCQHQHSCALYGVQGFVKMFGVGFAVQSVIKLLGGLGRVMKQPSTFLKSLVHKNNLRLGAFLGCFAAIFRVVNCILRWSRNKDDSLHGLLAGFLAGWSMIFYKSTTLALYTASKLAETLYFKGIAAGKVPLIRCADIIIYAISTAVVFHTAVLEPHNLRPAYWTFLLRVTDSKFAKMNRKILEPYVPGCSKMFPDFWPNYDPRYTDLARR